MVNVLRIAVLLVVSAFTVNRTLFFVDTYNKLNQESQTDMYMLGICKEVDYKQIGRHAALCDDIEHRLGTPVFLRAVRQVVDDTFYREVSLQGIVTVFIGLSIVTMISNLHTRYVRMVASSDGLPTMTKVKQN